MSKIKLLIEAVKTDDESTFIDLLKEGADPFKEMENGNTVIREAVLNSSIKVLKILLNDHSVIDFKTFYMPSTGCNELGYCPIHYARNATILDLLIEHGASIDQQTHMGHTLLMLMILGLEKEDCTGFIKLIMTKKPNLKKRGKFDYFAKNGSALDLVEVLISNYERKYAKRNLDSIKQIINRFIGMRETLL